MTAAGDIRAGLRRRLNGTSVGGGMVGPWTCLDEWENIDLIAFAAWTKPAPASRQASQFPILGFEVKVSRSDYRSELLKPYKRAAAMAITDQFYFAVPKGLLKEEELKWQPPDWTKEDEAYMRAPCTATGCLSNIYHGRRRRMGGVGNRKVPIPTTGSAYHNGWKYIKCNVCGGKGYSGKSRIELEAPTLWIPRDVGLVEIDAKGTHFTKLAPVHERKPLSNRQLGNLVRWASVRPDPNHDGIRHGLHH